MLLPERRLLALQCWTLIQLQIPLSAVRGMHQGRCHPCNFNLLLVNLLLLLVNLLLFGCHACHCCVSFVEGKPETLLNLARAVGQSMYSRKPGDKLDMRALSAPTSRTPPPPPHHPRLIRYGGGVIADVIVPPMSGSILFASSPIPGRGLSRGVTYGTGVGLASYMSDGLSRGFTYG